MRISITGGAGFIGGRLARQAATAGHDVVVIDNLSLEGTPIRAAELTRLPRVSFHHADVRAPDDLERLPAGPYDRVFHLAASFANARSVEHPLVDVQTNAEGTLAVLAWARRVGCGLFVYTGSSSSYGDAPVPFHEESPISPGTPYALTKLLGERYVAQSGLRHAIFRLFNVYGPGDAPGLYRNAIPNMLVALDRPPYEIEVLGAGATRDFTYVDDVVDVLLEAARFEGMTTNIGTGVETSIDALAQRLVTLHPAPEDQPPARIVVGRGRAWDHVIRRCADPSRLRERLPGACATSLEVGLRETARWLFETKHLARAPR